MSPRATHLRQHPQLALITGLVTQLDLLPDALAAVHDDKDAAELRDQARSIARVARILHHQLEAYEGLLGLPIAAAKRSR